MAIDPRELRNAFGSFMTGVTVVTTMDPDGQPTGFTANSFSSVSLDPPLLLVCLGKTAICYEQFMRTDRFAVNILSAQQQTLSAGFARKSDDKFGNVEWRVGPLGNPVLHGTCAWFECELADRIDGGDHTILLGRVSEYAYREREPLGFFRGGYATLGLERSAVQAWTSAERIMAGAIIDRRRALLLEEDSASAVLSPPMVEAPVRTEPSAQAESLVRDLGLHATQPLLFSVYEHGESNTQYIFYRFRSTDGDPTRGRFVPMSEIDWEKLPDDAIRAMLERYALERAHERFGVYLGDEESGIVR